MHSTSVTFRRSDVGDALEVARLATELGYPIEADKMQAWLAKLLPDPAHYVVVACRHRDKLLGWVHVEHRFSLLGGAHAEIMGLVVDPSVQREGIGGSLAELAETWASEHGLRKITVRSNLVRTASHPFYETHGYIREKTQHVYTKTLAYQQDSPGPGSFQVRAWEWVQYPKGGRS